MAARPTFRAEAAAEIVRCLEEGTAPWQRPWEPGATGAAPFNPKTGRPYRGFNNLWLSLAGHADPRWLTYNQARTAGAQVRASERARTIEYWQWSEKKAALDEVGNAVKDAEGRTVTRDAPLERPRVFFARVFNAEQIDGLEPWRAPEPAFEPVARAEHLLAGAGVRIVTDSGGRAYYTPARDVIALPPREAFATAHGFYATALHELGHASGHESRLARPFGAFGSESYAREELRAEMASYMTARAMGVGHDPSNHASYVGSWLKALKDDPNEIFRAAMDAEKISIWIMEPEHRPALEEQAQAARGPPARRRSER